MKDAVMFVGTYAIPEGSFDDWAEAAQEMVDFVAANAPRLISFSHYVNDDHTEASSIYVHPDSESFEQHLDLAASRINRGVSLVRVLRVDLYGAPSQRAIERLHRISEASAGFPVNVKAHYYGC